MTGGDHHHSNDWAARAYPMHPLPALFVSLFLPWRAAERAWRETSAIKSLLIHLAGAALFLVGLVILDSALWYGDILDELQYLRAEDVPLVFLVIGLWIIGIELLYLLAAMGTSAWGASIEPWRKSVGRSLSRWYQLTPFHALWTLALIVAVDIIEDTMWSSNYNHGTLAYEMRELLFGTMYLACFLIYCGVGGWFTLRALAIHRSASAALPKCRWPALCETCGYPVLGLGLEQACPECGRVVASSLDSPRNQNQPTTLQKMRAAILNPDRLGDTLQTRSRNPDTPRALAITALSLLLSGPVGVVYISLVVYLFTDNLGIDSAIELIQTFLLVGLGVGIGVAVGGISVVLLGGSIVGLIERAFGKRNSLTAACQAACFAGGYVVLIALLLYGLVGVFVVIIDRFVDPMNFGFFAVIPFTIIGTALLLTIPYLILVLRITRRARFANT
ncbi:MAG: hypothetical protein ACPGYV_09305 [Phycisphaeraceae bacterium]